MAKISVTKGHKTPKIFKKSDAVSEISGQSLGGTVALLRNYVWWFAICCQLISRLAANHWSCLDQEVCTVTCNTIFAIKLSKNPAYGRPLKLLKVCGY